MGKLRQMSVTKIPRGKTGPTTPSGKAVSSRNASKHNCTSAQLIVGDEDPDEFAALLESLTAEYQPETEMQKTTVMQAARTTWDLARVNREFDKSQQKLYGAQVNMHEWDAVQQAEFERMLRYRTRAERAYERALHQVEFLRKLRLQAQQRAFWENLQTEKLALSKERLKMSAVRLSDTQMDKAEAKNAAAAKEKDAPSKPWPAAIVNISQVIEIRLLDGTISIRVHPRTEDLRADAECAVPGTEVWRTFEFPDGIPAEYAWINAPDIRHAGVDWKQHFETVQDWLAHLDWEAAAANGGFLPVRKSI
jgi:hypothetical protein